MTRSGQLFALPTLVRRTDANGALSWATPISQEQKTGVANHQGRSLNKEVALWPAPQASDWKGANKSGSGSNSSRSLATAAEWQTPATFQGKYRRQVNQTERDELLLPGQAEHWATPMAADDGKKVTPNSLQDGLIGQSYRFGRPDHKMPKGGDKSSQQTRRLNPRFVEMLMGWPLGWTDFVSSETELSPSKPPSPSTSSGSN